MTGMEHTCPPHITRLILLAGGAAGLDRSRLTRVPGLAVAGEDGIRLPSASLVRIWQEWETALRERGGGTLPWKLWQPGSLGVWDYLFSTADTLVDAFREGDRHAAAITDPAESFTVTVDGAGRLTVDFRGVFAGHPVFPIISEFATGLILISARSAAGRPLTPVRVTLPGAAPRRHDYLMEAYGTTHLEFGAELPSVTFSATDARARLPRADPALATILRDHARTTLAGARPVLGRLDRFRVEVELSLPDGDLPAVAHRLRMAPRTLQRRLREEGTSWREEIERVRRQWVEHLLQNTRMTVESIAARTGYADQRALRRAIHRWYGHGPAALRRDMSPS
ncbi:helix-turn-helix domain-containing protein [Nonomuraea sp. NPDC047529]|uniref:helix-turn-helix domain-containing protein n=1 Tax=Nonomuraea sp. NPDC047529 TaxID=3155623 RepID=UPI0033E61ED0